MAPATEETAKPKNKRKTKMKTHGLALAEKLRDVAADTVNPERAGAMIQAADEITALIAEIRRLESAAESPQAIQILEK